MIKVTYTELDGPSGPTLRLEAAGHAGYAPAGQDIVCAGASTLIQTLVYLLAGEESAKSDAWDEPEGPRLAVTAAAPRKPWVEGAFEFAKAGFALLAERYPDNVRFADLSGRGEQCMVDLQLFAEGEGGAAPPPASAPALSRAQQQQAIASGTMKAAEAEAPAQPPRERAAEEAGETEQPEPAAEEETEGTVAEWKAALELAVKQRDEYLDSLRRSQADFQNFRRRNQTARSDGYEDGAREVVTAMLPVIDNLERAVDAAAKAGDENSPLLEGVKMTLKSLLDAGARFGLEVLPAEGCEFDPAIHHAVMRESTDDPGKVLEVFQKGYKVKDRVIRYAMVKVSVE